MQLAPPATGAAFGLIHYRGAFGIQSRIVSRVLKTCGISESTLDMRIGDYFREMRNPTIGVLAHLGEIHVRLTCKGDDPAEIRRLRADTFDGRWPR